MKHSVVFDGCDNHWDNALPFGNGVFGCMLFYEDGRLSMPMNHYEVYYNIGKNVLPEDILKNTAVSPEPGAYHKRIREMADKNAPEKGEPFTLYRGPKGKKRDYGIAFLSGSYPPTGELVFSFSDILAEGSQRLALYTEDALGELVLKKDETSIKVNTLVSRRDCIITEVEQSEEGLMTSVKVTLPECRDADMPKIEYKLWDSRTLTYTVTRLLSGEKPFVFTGVLRFMGAEVSSYVNGNECILNIIRSEKHFTLQTSVFTDWRYKSLPEDALDESERMLSDNEKLKAEHRRYWAEFFSRSSVSLPDPFLEKVYFVNQYAFDCCSGKDGIMKHHACGLNGLWDIRHPNLWGSMWYWDVNIQAAFAGVFSSNRLDLAKVFSDGLLTYTALAERAAYNIHGLKGAASDYPYNFYYSCWTWCAQYLWFLYEYSLDEEYLRNEAYPLFVKLCEFTLGIFEYDEEKDIYSVYPDISPEQGPLAHNTVITVACAKYLFRFTLEAAEILGERLDIAEDIRRVLSKMPEYPLSRDGKYGVHLRDSHDAPDDLWIRHPSMLMPVFPIGEYDISSNKEIVDIISNTLDFLEGNCEIGVFGCSWIAAAAARIGRGQLAYRTLYELGIDHMLRSNGLTAESTDRFINYCLSARQPLYYPCMMEFTGEMLAAVNEMLLQSHNGVIRVFPAIPDGDKEYYRDVINGYSYTDHEDRFIPYDAWRDVSFRKLLAKGAFEVSAKLESGELEYILIRSKKGGRVKVTSPFMTDTMKVFCGGETLDARKDGSILSFDTEEGKEYLIARSATAEVSEENDVYDGGVISRMSYTRRNIYIGGDKDTRYHNTLDAFIRDRYHGNMRISDQLVYKFDITNEEKKDYEATLPLMTYGAEGHLMRSMDFMRIGDEVFTPKRGYGFSPESRFKIVKREGPDPIRSDFAEGEEDAEFLIELPRGRYDILVISGDSEEDSLTAVRGDNTRVLGGEIVKKGVFQCGAFDVFHERDGILRLKISTEKGKKWKLNSIMLKILK